MSTFIGSSDKSRQQTSHVATLIVTSSHAARLELGLLLFSCFSLALLLFFSFLLSCFSPSSCFCLPLFSRSRAVKANWRSAWAFLELFERLVEICIHILANPGKFSQIPPKNPVDQKWCNRRTKTKIVSEVGFSRSVGSGFSENGLLLAASAVFSNSKLSHRFLRVSLFVYFFPSDANFLTPPTKIAEIRRLAGRPIELKPSP